MQTAYKYAREPLREGALQVRLAYNRTRGFARVGSVRLPVDRHILSERVERALGRGQYERQEATAARKLLRNGDVVLELGGGLGYLSAYLRSTTKIGRYILYEANPDLIPYIREVHRINQAIEIDVRHGVVVPNPSGDVVPFFVRADVWASSLSESDGAAARVVEVPTVSWRAVLDELKPTAAIVDIEGGELDLLDAEGFGSIQRLIVEAHPALYGIPGMKRLFAALTRHGFVYTEKGTSENVLALERSPTSPL